jgi:hypothetical protein
MKTWGKIILGTGAGVGILALVNKLWRVKVTGDDMEVIPDLKIHQLNLQGLTLRLDVQLKNPTKTELKIKYPFIKLLYQNVSIGSSQSINKDIVIPRRGETVIDGIYVKIPLLSVFTTASKLIQSLLKGEQIMLKVITQSSILLLGNYQSFTKETELPIKN